MKTKRLSYPFFAAVLTLLSACAPTDRKPEDATHGAEAGGSSAVVRTSSSTGAIRGVIAYSGDPRPAMLDRSKDPGCTTDGSGPRTEGWFVGGEGRTLGNVIVEIARGPNAWRDRPRGATPGNLVIEEVGCEFVPRVFAVRAGTTIEFKNSDPVAHSVHFYGLANQGRGRDHVAHPAGTPNLPWKLDLPEESPIRFRCDIHPWMTAFGRVLDHDDFVVTAKDGAFEFKNLPPGKYVVNAWHESFSDPMKMRVEVKAGETTVAGAKSFPFDLAPAEFPARPAPAESLPEATSRPSTRPSNR